jgi:hypothetical protein
MADRKMAAANTRRKHSPKQPMEVDLVIENESESTSTFCFAFLVLFYGIASLFLYLVKFALN